MTRRRSTSDLMYDVEGLRQGPAPCNLYDAMMIYVQLLQDANYPVLKMM